VKKKFTQGDLNVTFAGLGAVVDQGLRYSQSGNMESISIGIPKDFTGMDFRDGSFDSGYLVRGYGGIAHETGYRKLCQMIGSRPYPQKGSVIEHLAYYGAPAIAAYNNRGNSLLAFHSAYEPLYGIDLGSSGFDAWRPAAMLSTKGVLQIVKGIKRALREAGIKLPNFL